MNTSSATSPGTGTLRVMLKDAPAKASAVLVTFSDVSAHRSGGLGGDTGEWTSLLSETSITCDLTKLKNNAQLLGIGNVTQGHYTQIRLILPEVVMYQGGTPSESSSACVAGTVENAGTLVPIGSTGGPWQVTVPSGDIKLNHQFDLSTGTTVTITLDFDGDRSIHQTASDTFVMSPVISVDSLVVHQ